MLTAALVVVLVSRFGGIPDLFGATTGATSPVIGSTAFTGDQSTRLATSDILDTSIATWSQKVAWDANDYISATTLGGLYLQRARLTANLDDYERAKLAAEAAIKADPGYEAGRALEASVLFAIHDFAGALSTAKALLATDPANTQALATAADATLELGDLVGARALYAELTARSTGPAIDARLAHFAYLTGDVATALARARAARDVAVADGAGTDPTFYDYQLGETARLTGDASLARTAYTAALAVRPNDLGSLVGLARVDASDGDTTAAIAGLRHAAAIAPQPDTLALLGDLLAAQGDEAGAAGQYATVRTIAKLSALAGSVYDRQLLSFELDHGGASAPILERAREALAARPDAGGHDVVAWALYRLGRYDEAAHEASVAMATGIVDARILFHAGAIDLRTGQAARGTARIEQALALGPALDPLSRSEAERLLQR